MQGVINRLEAVHLYQRLYPRVTSFRPKAFHRRSSLRSHLQISAAVGFPLASLRSVFTTMNNNSEFKVNPTEKWWTDGTVAIVTGANKGIGKAIAQIFAENDLTTIVAARDESRGTEAVKDIKGITGAKNVFFEQLDLSDQESVKQFAKNIKEKYSNVSILVNNAGIAFKGNAFGAEEAQTTLNTNFIGTRNVCEAIVPLMTHPGRIVNVCSTAGLLKQLKDESLKNRFQDAKDPEEISQLAKEFVSGIKDNSYQQKGWSSSMYGISKVCEAAYTRILGEKLQAEGIDVNACCPGYVNTDMTSGRGHKTVEAGADTPAWLALSAPKGTSAKFFADRKERSF